ncbi:MAG: class I SAM-dependent methyltransferase [Parachlamydiaceae bacterium]|nr:class I SAM-dependent methyltransferase [Parachlamydiaceae bacterium]
MLTQVSSLQTLHDPDLEGWCKFIEIKNKEKEIPAPFKPVETLINNYLPFGSTVLDIGCETGKNAIPLLEAGHKVTLLDIAPNAISYTLLNLQQRGLDVGIVDTIAKEIEVLDPQFGPYDAVIGTYAFSFIPPYLFDEVMKNNVLGRVKFDGYFVGGFFGEKHSWAENSPEYTFLTTEKITNLFLSMNFKICEIENKIELKKTHMNGIQVFHTFEIIAKRNL